MTAANTVESTAAQYPPTRPEGTLIGVNLLQPVLSTCPLHTNIGCGKERQILIGPWLPAKAAPVRNYLEVYWPCAGGLSAVNAIGMQLRDPINSGLTRRRMAVSEMDASAELGSNPVSKHHIQPEYGNGQADAGRDA